MLKSVPVVIRLRESEIFRADVLKELKIDKNNLDHELRKQPEKYAWWASLHSEAATRVTELMQRVERLEARLSIEFRHGKKKVKVYEVKDYIRLSHRYRKLQKRLRAWEDAERKLKGFCEAFRQRKDALMASNANHRKEQSAASD